MKGKGRESAQSALGGRKEEGARVVPAWLAEPGGTLVALSWNLTSNHPRPSRSPCRWNPVWNPRLVEPYINSQNLVEPCLKPPRTTPQPLQNLVERWWNFRGTLPQTTPDYRRTPVWNPRLVEPYIKPPPHRTWWNPGGCPPWWNLKPPRGPRTTWWNPGRTLVEPWWNRTLPQTTRDHPAALAGSLNHPGPPRSPRRTWWNPGGTLVEPYLKPPRTTPQPLQNLVELWSNPRGTLPQGCPGPPRTLSGLRPQSFQLLGKNNECFLV